MLIPDASRTAARMTGILWAALYDPGAWRYPVERHYPRAVDTGWLGSLPLPLGDSRPADQPVALAHSIAVPRPAGFERYTGAAALAAAYAAHPRTQILEDIGYGQEEQWWAITAGHLTRLSHSELDVTCAVFSSRPGDENLGPHFDSWYGAVVQVSGVKRWLIGEDRRTVVMAAGDILLVPKYLLHEVSTPPDPGYSVHLVFEIDRDPPARAGRNGSRTAARRLPGEDGDR
jgi:hypothetical protein